VVWVSARTATARAWLRKASPMMVVGTVEIPVAATRSATWDVAGVAAAYPAQDDLLERLVGGDRDQAGDLEQAGQRGVLQFEGQETAAPTAKLAALREPHATPVALMAGGGHVQRLSPMILIGLSSQASPCLRMTQGDVHNDGQMTVRRS
jgi:hypothetical protein